MARLRFQVWLDIRDMQPEKLAALVGVSFQAVQRWLHHGIPQARVGDVAKALNISPSELQRFVDSDLSAELVDFAENVADRRRNKKSTPTETDTYENKRMKSRSIFDERRKRVDRRRTTWHPDDTECRRSNSERRQLQYHRTEKNWWLHVDYLDEPVTSEVS